ncbi:MAG: hypothetical protein M3N53_09985 [Actinomycetota bacterium]|nr:hypothetical protein [Actinomycetota bacterium]
MGFDRRLLSLLLLLAVVGVPAGILRVLCVGRACDEPVKAAAEVPFCSLPEEVRSLLAAGFREGRSPDLLGITGAAPVGTEGPGAIAVAWPSVESSAERVPLGFFGGHIEPPSGALSEIALDDVAPTIARLMGIERPHPEVRSGTPADQVTADEPAPLVVEIVWKGIGSDDLEAAPAAWRQLARRMTTGAGTLDATVPSVPLDPAAVLTTIGAGGVPAQHGVTGAVVRSDAGAPVRAWSRKAPVVVIAALGDDLDELTDQRARVGLVAADAIDRGLIGADWYADTDRDDVAITRRGTQAVRLVRDWVDAGYGADAVPDLLAVTLTGTVEDMDETTEAIADVVTDRRAEATLVVTATGSAATDGALGADELVRRIERSVPAKPRVVAAAAPGGLFLDQDVLAAEGATEDEVITAMREITAPGGERVFADVFPAIAVSFGRYC